MIVIPKCVGSHFACEDAECQCACHGGKRAQVPRHRRPAQNRPSQASPNPKRPQVTFLSEAQIEEIRRLYQDGGTIHEIARNYHCSHRKISAAVGDLALARRTFLDPEEVRRLYREGNSIVAIAGMFGKSKSTVRCCIPDLEVADRVGTLSLEQTQAIIDAHAQGTGVSELARQYNCERWTIYKALGRPRARG